jgi:hypothetical protein
MILILFQILSPYDPPAVSVKSMIDTCSMVLKDELS